jgi:hypothetical protein
MTETMTDAERNAAAGGHPVGNCDMCGVQHFPWSSYFDENGNAYPENVLGEWSARVTRTTASAESESGEAADVAGELKVHGLSIGHGCDDCFQLRIHPEVWHSAGASYHPVIVFTAGHGGERAGRGEVGISVEDLPAVIAELERLLFAAGDGSHLPEGWPVS